MSQVDEIGPWSEIKLELLRKYLNAYTTIMRRQEWCRGYHYIDPFAGTGRPRARGEERYIEGSPLVALRAKYPFHSYTFIEKEPWRVQKLQELKDEFPNRNILIYEGDCNEILKSKVVPQIRYEDYQRGLVFLDPFAMDVEWETVEALARPRSLEVLINFPVMAVNRTVLLNQPYKLTNERIEHMNRFLGTTEWRDIFYEEVKDMFDNIIRFKPTPTTGDRLGRVYKGRLMTVFPFVTDPMVVTNSINAPLYCLIFAGHNETGASIIQKIERSMRKETWLLANTPGG